MFENWLSSFGDCFFIVAPAFSAWLNLAKVQDNPKA